MFKWILSKLIGKAKKDIEKTLLQSTTTRTVAVASVSTIMIVRAILAFLAELGLMEREMVDDTALIICAVLIPLVSRLIALLRYYLFK
ncbi:MAG: hypothetical protein QXS54_03880 [Candidatus Methanomethylicaceae archaeon]